MASQYLKTLFNAAWQAELDLDTEIDKLADEYRISPDEIKKLKEMHRNAISINNQYFIQIHKEDPKES